MDVPPIPRIAKDEYKTLLYDLQCELVQLQRHLIATKQRVLVIFEGRDGAGKDGTIRRLTEAMSPRETRVIALGKPNDRERSSWYFQRYVPYLPADEEFVFFNRSWYNRAGVEPVMGFCDERQHEEFLVSVVPFEEMLVRAGIRLFKYYLDITHSEQKERLQARHEDPLKQWKISPIDEKALSLWKEYSEARNEMLSRTHHGDGPWTVVRADHKRTARVSVMKDLLTRLEYPKKRGDVVRPNPNVVFPYQSIHLDNGMISH